MTGDELTVIIDVPRGSFLKRDDDHAVDFLSPFPCPFNYGHVPDTLGDDGDALDAVVLGRRRPLGSALRMKARGRIDFIDAGLPDPKWICADEPLNRIQRLQVDVFFRCYAIAKRAINAIRGKTGPTRYRGWL